MKTYLSFPCVVIVFSVAAVFAGCANEGFIPEVPNPDVPNSDVAHQDLLYQDASDNGDLNPDVPTDADLPEDSAEASDFSDTAVNEVFTPDLPPSFPARPAGLPFSIDRPQAGTPPTTQEIEAFTDLYAAFLKKTDFLKWMSRHSQGYPEDNESGLPGYKVWWMSAHLVRQGNLVTLTFDRPPDNHLAVVGAALGPLAGLTLALDDRTARELTLGFIRGVSATYEGMVWGNETPAIESIMARAIFNRDFETTLDGGRRIAVDYTSVRYPEQELRHDTVHNPDNPTWGDIYVRNKRSKDDFPYLYRDMAMLVRLAWETRDDEIRDAAVKLYGQVRAMAADIVEHAYCIRTKDADGVPYIPVTEDGNVEDFATYTAYEWAVPTAECTGKLGTAYLASGTALDNVCEDDTTLYYGHGGMYEDITIVSHYVGTIQIWGNHSAAVALALTAGDFITARKLLDGLITRVNGLLHDERAAQYPEWMPDVAQLLIHCAAFGMPLTGEEARLVMSYYRDAAGFYERTVPWDPWDESVPENTECSVVPDRFEYDDKGAAIRAHVRIEEILSPFEYCGSAFKTAGGSAFVDCDRLLNQLSM